MFGIARLYHIDCLTFGMGHGLQGTDGLARIGLHGSADPRRVCLVLRYERLWAFSGDASGITLPGRHTGKKEKNHLYGYLGPAYHGVFGGGADTACGLSLTAIQLVPGNRAGMNFKIEIKPLSSCSL